MERKRVKTSKNKKLNIVSVNFSGVVRGKIAKEK
jgi:hypothetical protein